MISQFHTEMIISFASKLFGNESTVKNSMFYPFIDDFLNLLICLAPGFCLACL